MNSKIFAVISLILINFALSSTGRTQDLMKEGLYANVNTNKGLIVLKLEFEKTPMTVASFVGLSEGTIKNIAFTENAQYFSGSRFHRVVPGHVIQTGSPAGSIEKGPGYQFPNEIHPDMNHNTAGMVGMARSALNTNTSQWYITLGDRSYLNGNYTVFGSVIKGMDVVFDIVQDDKINSIEIVRIGEKAKSFKSDTKTFNELVERAFKKFEDDERTRIINENEYAKKNWPDAIELEPGVKFKILVQGNGEKPKEGAVLKLKYTGRTIDGSKFSSYTDTGQPNDFPKPNEFEYTIGTAKRGSGIPSGLAVSVGDMKKGEKRIVILYPVQAYGEGGFYSKTIEGRKRFIISPNKLLVYEIELINIK